MAASVYGLPPACCLPPTLRTITGRSRPLNQDRAWLPEPVVQNVVNSGDCDCPTDTSTNWISIDDKPGDGSSTNSAAFGLPVVAPATPSESRTIFLARCDKSHSSA